MMMILILFETIWNGIIYVIWKHDKINSLKLTFAPSEMIDFMGLKSSSINSMTR